MGHITEIDQSAIRDISKLARTVGKTCWQICLSRNRTSVYSHQFSNMFLLINSHLTCERLPSMWFTFKLLTPERMFCTELPSNLKFVKVVVVAKTWAWQIFGVWQCEVVNFN